MLNCFNFFLCLFFHTLNFLIKQKFQLCHCIIDTEILLIFNNKGSMTSSPKYSWINITCSSMK